MVRAPRITKRAMSTKVNGRTTKPMAMAPTPTKMEPSITETGYGMLRKEEVLRLLLMRQDMKASINKGRSKALVNSHGLKALPTRVPSSLTTYKVRGPIDGVMVGPSLETGRTTRCMEVASSPEKMAGSMLATIEKSKIRYLQGGP